MHVILVCSYFEKMDFKTFRNLQTNFPKCIINIVREHYSPVIRWTNDMIQQHGNIVALMKIYAHKTPYQLQLHAASCGESDPKRD